jgi:hypothetical protein
LLAAIDAIGKDVSELGKAAAHLLQQWDGAMAVLNIGWMDVDGEQKAIGVGDDMPLTPVNTFAGVVASRAPAWAVGALWLSMTAAVGVGLRPSLRRALRTRALTIFCHLPVSRQA